MRPTWYAEKKIGDTKLFFSLGMGVDSIEDYAKTLGEFETPKGEGLIDKHSDIVLKAIDRKAKVIIESYVKPAPALTPKAQEPPQQQGFTTHTVSVEGYLDHEGFKRRDWPDGNPKWERQDTELKVSIYSKDGFWVMAFYDVDTREKAYYKPGENKVYDEIMQNIHRIESVGGK